MRVVLKRILCEEELVACLLHLSRFQSLTFEGMHGWVKIGVAQEII